MESLEFVIRRLMEHQICIEITLDAQIQGLLVWDWDWDLLNSTLANHMCDLDREKLTFELNRLSEFSDPHVASLKALWYLLPVYNRMLSEIEPYHEHLKYEKHWLLGRIKLNDKAKAKAKLQWIRSTTPIWSLEVKSLMDEVVAPLYDEITHETIPQMIVVINSVKKILLN